MNDFLQNLFLFGELQPIKLRTADLMRYMIKGVPEIGEDSEIWSKRKEDTLKPMQIWANRNLNY